MQPESLLYRSLILLLVSLCSVPVLMSHNLYIVLQPVIAKQPNCSRPELSSSATSPCCVDCLGIGDDDFNLMFSSLYISGIVAVMLGGWLMDKFGNWLVIVFSTCSLIGYTLIAIGGSVRGSAMLLPLLMSGSFMWGIGFTTTMLARHRITASWFKDKELFLAFGIAASIGRLSAIPSFMAGEQIRNWIGLQWTLWLCPILGCVGIACAIGAAVMDACGCLKLGVADQRSNQQKAMSLFDLRHAGIEFWLLAAAAPMMAAVYSTYQENSVQFLHQVFSYTRQQAAVTSSVMEAAGIVAFPIIGVILDKLGRPIIFLSIVILLLIPSLLTLAYSHIHPIVCNLVIGIIQCFFSTAGLGSIPLLLNSSILGIGIAAVLSLRCGMLVIVHAAVAAIVGHNAFELPSAEKQQKWQQATWLLVALLIVAFALSSALCAVSWRKSGPLTSSNLKQSSDYEEIRESSDNHKLKPFTETDVTHEECE